MRKTKPHLKFYNRCMKKGTLPIVDKYFYMYQLDGLCECAEYGLISNDILTEYISPSVEEIKQLQDDGMPAIYWADGISKHESNEGESQITRSESFTPLRQTIVLFMAAINEEL